MKKQNKKEVNNFSEAFSDFMKNSPNLTIPEGALWAVNVNVDQYLLTEIKKRKFTNENNLKENNTCKFPVHHRRVTLLEAKQKGVD